MQKILGGDQFLGRDSECFSRTNQVGFVIGKEFERRSQDHRITQPGTQSFGIKPGQIEKARGALLALQDPAKRGQRQRLRAGGLAIGRVIFGKRDCPVLLRGVIGALGEFGASSDKTDNGCRGQ